jgi:hypothetical protein
MSCYPGERRGGNPFTQLPFPQPDYDFCRFGSSRSTPLCFLCMCPLYENYTSEPAGLVVLLSTMTGCLSFTPLHLDTLRYYQISNFVAMTDTTQTSSITSSANISATSNYQAPSVSEDDPAAEVAEAHPMPSHFESWINTLKEIRGAGKFNPDLRSRFGKMNTNINHHLMNGDPLTHKERSTLNGLLDDMVVLVQGIRNDKISAEHLVIIDQCITKLAGVQNTRQRDRAT